jgi:ATP-dependent Clp protease ATP-binding subunit ClpA
VFENFTDRARKVLYLAQTCSRRLGHNYIGTEHILLAILEQGSGVAVAALRNMDVDRFDLIQEIRALLPPSRTKGDSPMPENAPQNAPQAQKSTPTAQAAPHSAGAAPFPQEAVRTVADFLRGKGADRLATVRAVNTLLGWALDLFTPAEQQLTAGAAPAGRDGDELARSLEGLALAHGGAYPTAGAALTLPPWLLPLLAEVLRRALEQ